MAIIENNKLKSHDFINSISRENINSIRSFSRIAKISKVLSDSGAKIHCGNSAYLIFLAIFILKFINHNIYKGIVANDNCNISKDAVYDFLKSARMNWRIFLIKISSKIYQFIYRNNNIDDDSVIIIDDTTYYKERSKKLEHRSVGYDHVEHRHYKGYKMLNVLWSDPYTSLPLDFFLMSSPDARNRCQGIAKQLASQTNGAKRRKEAMQHATENIIESLKRIFKTAFRSVNAIMCDSWFAQAPLVIKMASFAPVITMLKKSSARSYRFKGKLMTIKDIYRSIKPIRKCKNIIASIIAEICDKNNNKISVKIIFIRHKLTGDWIPLLSTNIEYSSKRIVKLYSMRWNIEVFHKDIKTHLNLENGSQSTDYDAIIAYTTIILTRYIYLSYQKRLFHDPRAIGGLLCYMCEHVKEITFAESLKNIFNDFCLLIETSKDKISCTIKEIKVAIKIAMENALTNGLLSIFEVITQMIREPNLRKPAIQASL